MNLINNHLKARFLVLCLGFILSLPAAAKDFIFHHSDTQEMSEIQIQNKSRLPQTFWVLFYDAEFVIEYSFEIDPESSQLFSLDGLKKPLWNFSVLTKSNLVRPLSGKSPWELSPSSKYQMKLANLQAFELKFFNLYPEKQKVWLTYTNSLGQIISETEFTTAGFRKNLLRQESPPQGAALLNISSESPLVLSSSKTFKPLTDEKRQVSNGFKYFLVQGGSNGSNFVAPIDDPLLIQKARAEILNFQGFMIFADVELNPEQANRDFSSPQKNYWSWSIKKVTGLSQIGADWCQAYPEMIERMLHQILKQEQVCFRGQRIIRELKPSEVKSGVLN